ncbi:hypothetical protein SERLA73DRAFT_183239 [Serpula lacrymans var. lacrymans S7.3]|uniref:NAD(P)-binding protein n=2 Tax=Serpula lacrymans var. lacrymans TaxID=341189 RepID=F8PZI1_SERL3|nr:uncharacterized protein SERLADRAFT_470287 [Serpula lacrymans var. lacrymans S7.9]EGN98303.1 hypothetical protein SERLA73DRAFT_183239 [Serpula lacrymans var. lacrymans S7.3]EGO23870.1 hypothetical protein SERLADRAFT_470287 [Serpula lacrymans var. lacrymans S7.9]
MGAFFSLLNQAFPPKSNFSVDDIPDLTGKVIIVTGANTGIGKETAKALLSHNAKVYVAARSQEKSAEAIQDLKNMTGKEAVFLKLDLSSLKAVKAAAEEFLSKETRLHALINNAGVMMSPIDMVTEDGYDLQFGTNVLGPFYFTKLLLPALISGAKDSPDGKARVVNVSSAVHHFNGLDFNTFKDGPARKKVYSGFLYSQSKSGTVVFASELDKRYGDQGIVSTSTHPGAIQSELQRHLPSIIQTMSSVSLYPASQGALTQLYAATSPNAVELGGKYLIPWARPGQPRKDTQDPKIGQALWEWLEEQVEDI